MKNELILKLTIDPVWILNDKEIIRLEKSEDGQFHISIRIIKRGLATGPPAIEPPNPSKQQGSLRALNRSKRWSNKTKSTIKKYKNIDNESLKDTLEKLFHTKLPVFPDFEEFIDGTIYEIKLGGEFGGATFNWHCEPPKEWEPLGKFVNYLTELIESIEQEK